MHCTGKGPSDGFFSLFWNKNNKNKYVADASEAGEIDAEALLESLQKKVDQSSTIPKCIASKV